MKKKLSILISAMVLIFVSLMSAAPALAQENDETVSEGALMSLDGLALIAPVRADPETEVTMTVLRRSDAGPVAGAGVWAFTRENADTFNQELAAANSTDKAALSEADWETMAGAYGFFLGRTNENGKLTTVFSESGRYLLIAFKQGYLPGRTSIGIGVQNTALAIEAPRRTQPGEPVSMTVVERGTSEPVADAGVWALTREEAEALQSEVDALRTEDASAAADIDWESLVSIRGLFLGRTSDTGNLEYTFNVEGNYLLITVKPGYLPGRTGIAVKEVVPGLALETWRWAQIDEMVTMTVSDRESGSPVENAGVWALTREEATALQEEIAAIRESGKGTVSDIDLEAMVGARGVFLGRTNAEGNLDYAFSEAGGYALVTVKNGYIPGRGFINILPPRTRETTAEQAGIRMNAARVQPALASQLQNADIE